MFLKPVHGRVRRLCAGLTKSVLGGVLMIVAVARAEDAVLNDTGPEPVLLAKRIALGQRIYREGLGASGTPLVALGAAQTRLAGKDVACINCHRRSGYGASEGRFTIRSITGPALTQEQTVLLSAPRVKARVGASQRPPYTEALLARAIRTGTDTAGKPLDPLMPRYALGNEEVRALAAYLFTLSTQASPGVDGREVHFATVIQPDVSSERRRAMLDIMQAFFKDKDANVRQQEQRREAGNMRMDRAWRKWVLHVWELSGPSETWGAQLEAHYAKQPVFALIGGLGTQSWRAVHEFSERFEVPGIFPQVDLPVVAGANQYTLYFSRGATLEGEVLARFLRDQGEAGKIVQLHRRDEAGSTAAAALRTALAANPGTTLVDRVVEGPADEAFWRSVAAEKPGVVVAWLGQQDLENAQALGGADAPPVYLSFAQLGSKRPESLLRAGGNVRLVYPSDLPPKHEARLLRGKVWLQNKGIAVTDEAVQMNTQYALTIVSDAVGHIADSFSRDYFVERVEHVVGQTPMPSMYPQVSLGPGQRFASKGSSVVQLLDATKPASKALSGWIVP